MSANKALIDRFTLAHIGAGALAGYVGVPTFVAMGASVVYEVVEYAWEYPHGSKFFGTTAPESLPNILSDLVVYYVGFQSGRALRTGRGESGPISRTVRRLV